MNITELSVSQLKKAVTLKERIAKLETELARLIGSSEAVPTGAPARKRKMSAAGRARIIAAQKKRWAKIKAAKAPVKAAPAKAKVVASAKPAKATKPAKKWKLSAAGLAKIKAANKAYWAQKKAAKKA